MALGLVREPLRLLIYYRWIRVVMARGKFFVTVRCEVRLMLILFHHELLLVVVVWRTVEKLAFV